MKAKTAAGMVRGKFRKALNYRTFGAGTAIFDPKMEEVLLLKSLHNRVFDMPGGGLGWISRSVERVFTDFGDDPISVPSYRQVAIEEVTQETGITQCMMKDPPRYSGTYYGNHPKDTFSVFTAALNEKVDPTDLRVQSNEVGYAFWQPIDELKKLGTGVHFVIAAGAIEQARSVLSAASAQ
jgi:8-oxo-dGTP pyrophosphatase MutT (NUDIX family)